MLILAYSLWYISKVFYIATMIFMVVAFFSMLDTNIPKSQKIIWSIVMLLLPLVGSLAWYAYKTISLSK